MRQYGQGLDRLLGLRPRDMLELAEKVNGLTPMQESIVKVMSEGVPDERLGPVIRQVERMRAKGTGMPALDDVFNKGVDTGQVDIGQFNNAVIGPGQEPAGDHRPAGVRPPQRGGHGQPARLQGRSSGVPRPADAGAVRP